MENRKLKMDRKFLGGCLFRYYLLFSIFTLPFSLTACGYTTRSNLPSRFHTIHVKSFENKVGYSINGEANVYLPHLEVDVTNANNDRFIRDGYLKVAQENRADLVLSGELLSFERGGLRFSDNSDIEEYRITITVSMTLLDTKENLPKWSESSYSGGTTYFLTGPNAISEDAAVQKALKDLAQRVVERVLDDW